MDKLKVYFFGYGGHASRAEQLRPVINDLGMELITIHEGFHDCKPDVPWDRKTYVNELKKADIIILPQDIKKWPAKSCNKLTQALSLGKPVICSSQDSYKAVDEKYPGCCIFADSDEEWKAALEKLRDDRSVRQSLSEKGFEASKDYTIDVIGNKWVNIFKNRDKCDIVIPTYNNFPCLKLCIESIRACTKYPHNVIVVNNGPDESVHEYLEKQKDIKYIKTGRMTFAQAVNVGIKTGKEKYVMILNDDIIVSHGWLTNLVSVCENDPKIGAVGPLSNCDRGWLHDKSINIGGVELLPGVNTREQIEPVISQIYDYKSLWSDIVEREWVAFYCTLIPRKVIDEVGILNERYINSGEDLDLCRRIRNKGYKIVQSYKSFVFHFGAVGRKILESENKESYQENDRRTQSILKEIWSKKTVVIYTGPAWERWDFRNLDKGGIAGSETWAIQMARSFSRLGYRVIVFADCPENGIKDGDVEYLHYNQWGNWIDQHWIDYLISSRTTDTLKFPVRAGKVYVLSHDIWLLSPREQLFMDKVDKFCVLSEWHRDFFSNHHGVPKDKIWITSNGLDFDRFNKTIDRDPYRLIWSSSWDRGLDNVLYLLPFLRDKIPQINLHIFYGVLNWTESCKRKNDIAGLQKIESLKKQIKDQPNVFEHGRISQDQLAEEFLKSSLWLYPSWFSETYSISAIEAQAAGVPVLANNFAGIKTTIGDSGILLGNGNERWPYTKEGREAFFAKTIELLINKDEWEKWSQKGLENVKKYSWDEVAKRWQEQFNT